MNRHPVFLRSAPGLPCSGQHLLQSDSASHAGSSLEAGGEMLRTAAETGGGGAGGRERMNVGVGKTASKIV